MKRLLLILLLMVVPFQMSWAAASAYCQHEEGAAARHLGHHSHQHKTSKLAPDAAKATADIKSGEKTASKLPFGQADGDCCFCHGFGQATLGATPAQAEDTAGLPDSAARAQFYRSHIPDGPKRPDWRTLA